MCRTLAARADWVRADWLASQKRPIFVALQDALQSGAPAAAIEAATSALAKGTEAFAAQRMNRGIRDALAGKNVGSL